MRRTEAGFLLASWLALALLAGGGSGCASPARIGPGSIAPRSAVSPGGAYDCGAAVPGEERLAAPLVLVGDFHGTRELPPVFGHLVCRAATGSAGKTVLVGLEMPADGQAALDAFLAGSGGDEARRDLLAQEHWTRGYQDGRSSEAVLGLLDELRRLRRAGLPVAVRALDPPKYGSPSERDAGMASNLAEAVESLHPVRTLVLVGNVHTRTLNGYPWDAKAAFVPLGAVLRQRYPGLLALDVKTLGGTAWTCTSAAATDCGAHALRDREPTGATPRVELAPDAAPTTGYDGVLLLGRVSASPPARPPGS